MEFSRTDVSILLYNFAVVYSGGYVTRSVDGGGRWTLVVVALALALAWTIYFRFSMVSRLSDDTDGADRP